jgi:hypothetical protein
LGEMTEKRCLVNELSKTVAFSNLNVLKKA